MTLVEITDPLEDLQIELWLRHKFGFTTAHAVAAKEWLAGEGEFDPEMNAEMFEVFERHYAADIPYDVMKDADPITADEWFHARINHEMEQGLWK